MTPENPCNSCNNGTKDGPENPRLCANCEPWNLYLLKIIEKRGYENE